MTLKRSTPLRSRSYLKRKKRINPKRPTTRRSGRVRDRAYLLRVKELPCVLIWDAIAAGWMERCDGERCEGPVEADHAGPRPLGRKCSDYEAIPLCRKHHRERTDYTGVFGLLNGASMRRWCDLIIANTQATLGYVRRAA